MPPAKSELFGPCTIWDLDEDAGDGGESSFLTSKIYPAELTDRFSTTAVVNFVGVISAPHDFLEVTAQVLDVSLVTTIVFGEYEFGPESLEVSAEVLGIDLTTLIIFSEYDLEPESLEVGASVLSVDLEKVRDFIFYETAPDSAEMTAEVLSITLETA